MRHVITTTSSQIFPTSWVYYATCSCEEYESAKFVLMGAAENAGRNHVQVMMGESFNPVSFYRELRYVEESLLETQ